MGVRINLFLKIQKKNLMTILSGCQKQSFFDTKKVKIPQHQPQKSTNHLFPFNETSHSKGSSTPSLTFQKVIKGLPSLLKNDLTSNNQKEKIVEFNPVILSKENKIFQNKIQCKQKIKRTENYYFSSIVPRNSHIFSSKPISKSPNQNQFKIAETKDKQNQPVNSQFLPYITSNTIVNHSLVDSQYVFDHRDTSIQANQTKAQISKIFIDCFNENTHITNHCLFQMKKHVSSTLPKSFKQFKKTQKFESIGSRSQFLLEIAPQLTKKTSKINALLKKVNKTQQKKLRISFYKSSDSQNLSEEQQCPINKDDTPGPGTYEITVNIREKKSFRSKKQKFQRIFISPLERFKADKIKYQQITYLNQKIGKKVRQNSIFLSKTPKNIQIQTKNGIAPVGTYNPRNSMEHQIIRNILKSSTIYNSNLFSQRFKYSEQNCSPSPGQYNLRISEQQNWKTHQNPYKKLQSKGFSGCKLLVLQKNNKPIAKVQSFDKENNKAVIKRKQQYFDGSQLFKYS